MSIKKTLPFLVIALLLGIAASLLLWKPQTQLLQQSNEPAGGDFTLDSAQGPVSLSDFSGKVVLLYFGYTYCPDICPTSLSRIAGAFNKLAPQELSRVQAIFVSVDPNRDTPERLAEYAGYFHPGIIGVTGSKQQIDEIAARYGASYRMTEGTSATNYLVDHSALIYVLDQNGKIREFLPHAVSVNGVISIIRKLLQEPQASS